MTNDAPHPNSGEMPVFRPASARDDLSGRHSPSPAVSAPSDPESRPYRYLTDLAPSLCDIASAPITIAPCGTLSGTAVGFTFPGPGQRTPVERVFTVETGNDQVPDRAWINGAAFVPIGELHEATQAADTLKDRLLAVGEERNADDQAFGRLTRERDALASRVARLDASDEILIAARHDLMVEADKLGESGRGFVDQYARGDLSKLIGVPANLVSEMAELIDRLAAYLKGQDERLLAAGDHIERGDQLLAEARVALLAAGTYTDAQLAAATDVLLASFDPQGESRCEVRVARERVVIAVAQALGARRAEA